MDTLHDNAAHILIVDDDQRIRCWRATSSSAATASTLQPTWRARGRPCAAFSRSCHLDVMMPGGAARLARELKAFSTFRSACSTAKAETEERIEAGGQIDYVAKPFEPRELLLQLQGILRGAGPRAA
jgi:two-component system phosphate regulon response regulator OmpR